MDCVMVLRNALFVCSLSFQLQEVRTLGMSVCDNGHYESGCSFKLLQLIYLKFSKLLISDVESEVRLSAGVRRETHRLRSILRPTSMNRLKSREENSPIG